MKIQKIHIKDYKRFHDLTIDLGDDPKRIVALVGPNGCGKSSVFDAMLYKDRMHGCNRKTNKGEDYHILKKDAPAIFYENIDIIFNENEDFNEVRNKLNSINMEYTLFSFRSSYRYNSNLKVKTSKSIDELTKNSDGAGTASDLDDRMENNYRRLYSSLFRLLIENKKEYTLEKVEEKIIGELNKSLSKCLDLKIHHIGMIDDNSGTIFFKKNDSDVVFEYTVLSSGEKEVVDILLDLYLRKDIYKNSIYIIDEPELHLNSSIQRKLLIEINKIIPENCQLWIATHSIGFIRALQEELNEESQIIEFDFNNNWASEKYNLKPVTKSRSDWKKIFSVAIDDLSELIVPKQIVYCEGKDIPNRNGEPVGLDERVYNTIFGDKYSNTVFVSSGGSTELEQRSEIALIVLSKVIKDVEILILKDMDMVSGKAVNEIQRKQYLENNDYSHRILNRFEIENYLYDKEVLKKYCELNALQFDEGKYDRTITDIYYGNYKDEIGIIKSICGVNASISKDCFKINLAKVISEDMQVYKELEDCIFNRK